MFMVGISASPSLQRLRRAARRGATARRRRRPRTWCRCRPCPAAGRMPSFSDSFCAARTAASHLGGHRRVALLVPLAERDQMRLQPLDRIAERPRLGLVGRAVAGRIVGGRMALGAIGEELDQRRPAVGARALGRPVHRGIDRERVIAVDAQAGDAIADRALGEGRALGAGNSGEARDRPLVVDHREDDRHVVDRGEGHRGMEVALGGRAVADPAHGDAAVALDRRAPSPSRPPAGIACRDCPRSRRSRAPCPNT